MASIVKQAMGKYRKWVAMLAYSGNGYYGMQRQVSNNQVIETLPTIESELLNAFFKAGLINEKELVSPQLMRFQRAARTDKGVSAIKQIVSLNLSTDFPELIPQINEALPPQIRVMGAKRATKYFDCKNFCDARTYSYLLPTFAICPVDQITTEDFRISEETIEEFNSILGLFKGTHNYHNFTSHKKPTDCSAQRYIMSFDCSGPFLLGNDDKKIEFVVARVKGQSFMLHQIRKMLGIAIAVMRGFVDKSFIERSFGQERLDIPMAPGLGLLLEEVHYEKYNEKYGGDGIHEALLWNEYSEEIDKFKNTYIYSHIAKVEIDERSMFNWLSTLTIHTYDVRPPGPNKPIEDKQALIDDLNGQQSQSTDNGTDGNDQEQVDAFNDQPSKSTENEPIEREQQQNDASDDQKIGKRSLEDNFGEIIEDAGDNNEQNSENELNNKKQKFI